MKNLKKVISTLLVITILALANITSLAAASTPTIILNNKKIVFDVQPKTVNKIVLVQLTSIAKALGATTEWQGKTKSIQVKQGTKTITLTTGKAVAKVNAKDVKMTSVTTAYSGKTFVPLTFIVQQLGAKMTYNSKTNTYSITLQPQKNPEYTAWLNSLDNGVNAELLQNTTYLHESKTMYESYQKAMNDIYNLTGHYYMERVGANTLDDLVDMYLNNARNAMKVSCNYDYRKVKVLKDNLKQIFSYNFNYGTTPDYVKDIVDNKIIMESQFFTGKGLITEDEIKQPGVRGTLKYRYLSNNNLPKGKKLNTWYEDDILVTFYVEDTGLKVHYWEEIASTRLAKGVKL